MFRTASPLIRLALAILLLLSQVVGVEGFHWPLALMVLGAVVLVPLARQCLGAHWLSSYWVLLAAVMLGVSTMSLPGVLAALLALPWVGVTWAVAMQAMREIWSARRQSLAELCVAVANVQLAVGGAWLLADRLAWDAFGFGAVLVRLTAAHFHFAGFVLPIFMTLLLREASSDRWLRCCVAGVLLGVPFTALGITLTRLGFSPGYECGIAVGFCICVLGLGISYLRLVLSMRSLGLMLSALSLLGAMLLALGYALRWWWPVQELTLPFMWVVHGSLQVFGFAGCGVCGWLRVRAGRGSSSGA
jgi:hypothetical protein